MINLDVKELQKISKYLKEYKIFSKYLPPEFIEEEYIKFCDNYNIENGINPEIYFGLYIQNIINYELCMKCSNSIELEIELIDKYMPILEFLIRKLKITKQLDKEGILIKAIDAYDGTKLFSLHILDVLRKTINPELEKRGDISFDEEINDYIDNNKLSLGNLTYLDNLFIKLNVFEKIVDENLRKYAYLKFGYFNHYFIDSDIMKILNIENEKIKSMYERCLILLKEVINDQIEMLLDTNFKQKTIL